MIDNQDKAQRPVENLVIEYDSADDLVLDYTEHLASGTVFLDIGDQLEPGTRVCLQLSFPGLRRRVQITGAVRWPRGQGAEPGVGIELDPPETRTLQDALVERIRRGDKELVGRLIRILVVEDNPHVAQLIRTGLQGAGRRHFGEHIAFDFRMATNGREAIDALHQQAFDALIIDMYLPILDGAHVISHVRQTESLAAVPIVAVSAGGKPAQDAALAAGADHFLAKPMRLKQVTEIMRSLFSRE